MKEALEFVPMLSVLGPVVGITFLRFKGATKMNIKTLYKPSFPGSKGVTKYRDRKRPNNNIVEVPTGVKAEVHVSNQHGEAYLKIQDMRQGHKTGKPFGLLYINDQEKPFAIQPGKSKIMDLQVKGLHLTARHSRANQRNRRRRIRK